jgi:hypothetical protein
MKDPIDNGEHETRMIFRRCRCGTLLSTPDERCAWHAVGSARYASDLLTCLIATVRRPQRTPWRRLLTYLGIHKESAMNLYMFEYIDNGNTERDQVHAVDSLDAFDAFRAEHPRTPIANVWVERFDAK